MTPSCTDAPRPARLVLPGKGAELAQDQGGSDHAVPDRHGQPQDIVPMGANQAGVDPAAIFEAPTQAFFASYGSNYS